MRPSRAGLNPWRATTTPIPHCSSTLMVIAPNGTSHVIGGHRAAVVELDAAAAP
jgi:hypothetical protein